MIAMIIAAIIMDVAFIAAGIPALSIISLVVLAIAFVFSSLTVEIDDRTLRAYFGPGLTVKQVAVADIAAAEVMPASAWNGWGIRVTTRGMLYNVSGRGAVELTLKSGQRFRIGTDEEERLKAAIDRAAGAANGLAR